MSIQVTMLPRQLVCDFCCIAPPTVKYPIRTFTTKIAAGVLNTDYEGWGACEVCQKLIEAGDNNALAVRSAQTLIDTHPNLPGLDRPDAIARLVADMRHNHDGFFANRTGPAIPVTPDQEPLPPTTVIMADTETINLLVALAQSGMTYDEAVAYLRTQNNQSN